MLQCTNQILTTTYINTLKKKKVDRVDSGEHWPTSIKEIIQWFPFLTVIEHPANIM